MRFRPVCLVTGISEECYSFSFSRRRAVDKSITRWIQCNQVLLGSCKLPHLMASFNALALVIKCGSLQLTEGYWGAVSSHTWWQVSTLWPLSSDYNMPAHLGLHESALQGIWFPAICASRLFVCLSNKSVISHEKLLRLLRSWIQPAWNCKLNFQERSTPSPLGMKNTLLNRSYRSFYLLPIFFPEIC